MSINRFYQLSADRMEKDNSVPANHLTVNLLQELNAYSLLVDHANSIFLMEQDG